MFTLGGTDVYLHKYLGANNTAANATADKPVYSSIQPTNIQDLLFLENRDRTYDTQIYRLRCLYNVQNIDFNLSQFGLFIDNDTLFMTVHINDFIKFIGRKPISGDVLELPHLRDDFALNTIDVSMPRYYVIEDVGRASEGFSVTWYPHLYRLKIKKIVDSQQYAQIFNQPAVDGNGDPTGTTLRDLISTYNQELSISDSVVAQAAIDAPKSGFETRQYYTLAVDPNTGKPKLESVDSTNILVSQGALASDTEKVPMRSGYTGYLLGDGYPVNGYTFGFGVQFPSAPADNDFYLRVDFLPNRLFRFDGGQGVWIAVEDAIRMDMTPNSTRASQKYTFINNDNYTYFDPVVSDFRTLAVNVNVIQTLIPAGTTIGLYLVLQMDLNIMGFVVANYPGLLTTYQYLNPNNGILSSMIQINLPVVNGVQAVIPYAGQWTVTFYNDRVAEKQSISKALKARGTT
jgi:hypothetical protein